MKTIPSACSVACHVLEMGLTEKIDFFCVCVCVCLYRALFFSDGDTELSGFQLNPESPLYFYFVESNNNIPADSGFNWNMADSSGFQWNRHDARAL
jgi:hypothetical protein